MIMDMERLERAWTGAANRAEDMASLYLIDSAMAEVKRRGRQFRLRMGLIGAALGGWSVVAAYGIAGAGNVDPVREWGSLLLLAIAWTVFVIVVRRGWEGAVMPPATTLPSNLRALLAEVEGGMARIRLMAIAVPLFLAALGLTVIQLGDVGKMSGGNIRDFALLAAVGFGLSGSIFTVRYHRALKPEAARLRRLLAQYDDRTSNGPNTP